MSSRKELPVGSVRWRAACAIAHLWVIGGLQQAHGIDRATAPTFYVPPVIPLNGSKLWQVDGKINICTSPWTPMVDCTLGAQTPPRQVSGFYSELTKMTLSRIGWTEDDWVVSCMDWDVMVDNLYAANGTCFMVAAGVAYTVEKAKRGMLFSWPNFHNELVILISATGVSNNIWGFLTPFTWQLWVALIMTGVAVGFLVWVAEWSSTRREARESKFSQPTLECVSFSAWQATGKIVQMTQNLDKVNTMAARIIVWAYGLLIMVVIATYTGNTAAQLTTVSLQTSIHGLADLRGKAVGTWDGYQRIFNGSNAQTYPFLPQYLPWNNKHDEVAMISALRSGRLAALIIDRPFADNKASMECDLHVVGAPFEPTDLAFAFPTSFPNETIIDIISQASKANEEEWRTKPLINAYFTYNSSSSCPDIGEQTSAISITQMLGLWYILGCAMAVAILVIIGTHVAWASGTNKAIAEQTRSIAQKSMAHTRRFSSNLSKTKIIMTRRSGHSASSQDGVSTVSDSFRKRSGNRVTIAIDKPSTGPESTASPRNGGAQNGVGGGGPGAMSTPFAAPAAQQRKLGRNVTTPRARFYGTGILNGHGETETSPTASGETGTEWLGGPRGGKSSVGGAGVGRGALRRTASENARLERVAEWVDHDVPASPAERQLRERVLSWQQLMRRQQVEVEDFLASLRSVLAPSTGEAAEE